ncbi:hypothetical protein FBY33_1297 [Arthrobacter sp. SLBN-112]|jgi:hypothetical protein|uniref:hypothetical protein n=1 Tax=Arthrobacter sp. SLBN-112 TaxID=2768452 RepID=UPI001153E7D8|nr:hypothetical protein [Arthrobacter sp. SLBN-112]TQJ39283.1 hypothetical protein FBY33_1297 [Arthrobacter sp. SLBN-112]
MTQTASSPLGPQLTVSVLAEDAPAQRAAVKDPIAGDAEAQAQGFAAAAGLAGALPGPLAAVPPTAVPLSALPLVPELEQSLGLAAAAVGEEEGDVLSEVWSTSSHLESMQWELDNALESLRQAVRRACAAGVSQHELCTAANLTADELTAVLMPATDGPAAIQL